MFKTIFYIYRNDAHIIIRILGIKLKFRNPLINQYADMCYLPSLEYLKAQNTIFKHPIGIVINKECIIGKNCEIYQGVTLGRGKYFEETKRNTPIIGSNVKIYANATIVGGVMIGDNAIIGAGSVVINNVDDNTLVAGNPASVIRKIER